jgi:lipopolysaccharide export LptBFGC system permease protein LptF
MPVEKAESLGQRFRRGLRTYRYIIAILIFAAGILLVALALGDFLGPIAANSVVKTINGLTDQSPNGGPNYNLAFAILGPITFIVGAYLTGAYVIARRKFEHLMETKSKAEFLRNIPELEQILWDLTPVDERRYLAKRSDLKIRR